MRGSWERPCWPSWCWRRPAAPWTWRCRRRRCCCRARASTRVSRASRTRRRRRRARRVCFRWTLTGRSAIACATGSAVATATAATMRPRSRAPKRNNCETPFSHIYIRACYCWLQTQIDHSACKACDFAAGREFIMLEIPPLGALTLGVSNKITHILVFNDCILWAACNHHCGGALVSCFMFFWNVGFWSQYSYMRMNWGKCLLAMENFKTHARSYFLFLPK